MSFRRVGVCLFGLLLLPGFHALAEERFRLISSETPAALERKLQAAVTGGFHLLAAARGTSLSGRGRAVVLLERDAPGEAPAEYAVLTTTGDLAATAADGDLTTLAASGYRLRIGGVLPDSPDDWWVPPAGYESQVWLIMERRGPGGSYAYDAFGYETPETFARAMSSRLDRGYEVLGILNSARRLRVLFELDLGDEKQPRAPAPIAPGGRYRMLLGSRKLGVRMQLNDAARQGYRLAGIADASTLAPPMILVKKSADPLDEHLYRTLYEPGAKIYKDKLEQKLNKSARKGLRVVPGAITSTVVVFERSADAVEYRTLSSTAQPDLAEQLTTVAAEGFALVALFVNGDETTVVVERAAPPGRQP